jgi:hypothetical protein
MMRGQQLLFLLLLLQKTTNKKKEKKTNPKQVYPRVQTSKPPTHNSKCKRQNHLWENTKLGGDEN